MALIVDRPLPPGTAATHALVVGVGSYPALPPAQAAARDLSTAAASATAFAEWLRDDYHNPGAPLSTIEMLFTPGPNGATPWPGVEAATRDNLKGAVRAWYHRCNVNPSHVAILYFAGHGVWFEEPVALTTDFDPSDPIDPWLGAFSIRKTHNGLGRCAARAQIFIVDACQTLPADLADSPGMDVPGLIQQTLKPGVRDAPLLLATSPGQAAYGLPGQTANFTRALLHILRGAGADQRAGQWEVRTSDLVKVRELLRHWADLEEIPDQIPDIQSGSGVTLLHVAGQAPLVDAVVTCVPDQDLALVDLEIRALPNGLQNRRGPDPSPWKIRVPKGIYEARATKDGVLFKGPTMKSIMDAFGIVEL